MYPNDPITDAEGKTIGYLNSSLLMRQGVSQEQHSTLLLSHQLKHILFEGARSVLTTEQNEVAKVLKLRLLAKVFDSLESEQQKLWGFPVDPTYHRFFDFPGCACPKMDNGERIGTGMMIRNLDCLIHGGPADEPTAEQHALKDLLESYHKLSKAAGVAANFNDVPSVRAARKLI